MPKLIWMGKEVSVEEYYQAKYGMSKADFQAKLKQDLEGGTRKLNESFSDMIILAVGD
jgi:hypothetical protein